MYQGDLSSERLCNCCFYYNRLYLPRVTPTHIANHCNIKNSIMSDSAIIALSIVGELLTIDSEKALYGFCKKNMRDLFPRFCHRTRSNRTRRNLHAVIEEIRKEISMITGYAYQTISYCR